MVFDSENYNVFMYVAILVVTLLIFFNSVNLVETGLKEFEYSANNLGKGLTGLSMGDVEEPNGGKFSGFIDKVIDQENGGVVKKRRYVTGYAVSEDEEEIEEEIAQDTGELYTENSYLIYYMLIGFVGFCIFLISVVFFLPKLKEYT